MNVFQFGIGQFRALVRSRPFKVISAIGLVVFSAAFLGYLVYKNWSIISTYRWQINYAQLALTSVFDLCAYALAALAWHSIIKRLAGVASLSLNLRAYCYGTIAGRLPGVAWNIATRAVLYAQREVSEVVVGLASLLEIGLITLSGVLFYLALAPFTVSYSSRLGSWPLVVALALGILLTHPRAVTFAVRRTKRGAMPISLRYQDTLRWLVIYVGTWVFSGLLLFTTIRVAYNLSARYLLQVLADWTLAGIITSFATFAPTTLGLKEVALTLLLSRYMPQHIAVAAAVFLRLLMVSYSMLWALLVTCFKSKGASA